MNETPDMYIHRILSFLEGKDPLKVQAATPERISGLVRNSSPATVFVRFAK